MRTDERRWSRGMVLAGAIVGVVAWPIWGLAAGASADGGGSGYGFQIITAGKSFTVLVDDLADASSVDTHRCDRMGTTFVKIAEYHLLVKLHVGIHNVIG